MGVASHQATIAASPCVVAYQKLPARISANMGNGERHMLSYRERA